MKRLPVFLFVILLAACGGQPTAGTQSDPIEVTRLVEAEQAVELVEKLLILERAEETRNDQE